MRKGSILTMTPWQFDERFITVFSEMSSAQAKQTIQELCQSKADEFKWFGYEQATAHDIWLCVSGRYKKNQQVTLNGLISSILTLKPLDWMNWTTMSAWKSDWNPESDQLAGGTST